jgi:hypothetical protein
MFPIALTLFAMGSIGAMQGVAGGPQVVSVAQGQTYEGWKGCWVLSNDTVDIVVVPQIGRIMRYGYLNGRNMFWNNPDVQGQAPDYKGKTWQNFGGDKVWIAPQGYWNWPPDKSIDPGYYSVQAIPNGIRLVGRPSSSSNAQITREITLAPHGAEVSITNILSNRGETRPISVWEVAQMDDPDRVYLRSAITSYQPLGWTGFGDNHVDPDMMDVKSGEIWLTRSKTIQRKFGSTTPEGELRSVKGSTMFHFKQEVSKFATYPDQNSAQEVFLSADPYPYVELEQLGQLQKLDTRQVLIQKVTWSLTNG